MRSVGPGRRHRRWGTTAPIIGIPLDDHGMGRQPELLLIMQRCDDLQIPGLRDVRLVIAPYMRTGLQPACAADPLSGVSIGRYGYDCVLFRRLFDWSRESLSE
jgi:hypothetical protein